MRYSIYSYGQPRFELGEKSVQFSDKNAPGKIWFEPEYDEFQTLGGDIIRNIKGWRARTTVRLYNLFTLDHEKHTDLIDMMNMSASAKIPLRIYPRFATGKVLGFDMLPEGKFGYEDIANLDVGQYIELEFKSQKRLSEVPKLVNLPAYLLVAVDGYLLISSEGNKVII